MPAGTRGKNENELATPLTRACCAKSTVPYEP
jgi:hypothetical protein